MVRLFGCSSQARVSDIEAGQNSHHPAIDEEHEEHDDDELEILPEPVLEDGYIPRCVDCNWEVIDGFCQGCIKEHAWEDVRVYSYDFKKLSN